MRAAPGSLLLRRWPAGSYRGFDGTDVWPEELLLDVERSDGLAELDHWPKLDAIARANAEVFPYDAVIVARTPSVIAVPQGASFFDDDEDSHFSSIRNEAMRTFPELLVGHGVNEFGLLATLGDVARYAEIRAALLRDGRNVETAGDEQYAIMVFGSATPISRPL